VIWGFDTSVLVAALVAPHPRHRDCRALLERSERGEATGTICAHALAETFSVLTRLPLRPVIRPADAELLVGREVAARLQVVPVDSAAQLEAIRAVTAAGRSGGAVHDALHVVCLRRAGVERIWTLNRSDFLPFWDEAHITEPGVTT
jgi:predicted nucleic acid-binding protein